MGQIIRFPSPAPRDAAAAAPATPGELIAIGRNDLATVIETIGLLREAGRGDLLDEFNRGASPERRSRRGRATGA